MTGAILPGVMALGLALPPLLAGASPLVVGIAFLVGAAIAVLTAVGSKLGGKL